MICHSVTYIFIKSYHYTLRGAAAMDEIKINVGGIKIITEQKREDDLKQLSAKLHPEYDQDLIREICKIPKRDRSKIYRDALRMYFKGIK